MITLECCALVPSEDSLRANLDRVVLEAIMKFFKDQDSNEFRKNCIVDNDGKYPPQAKVIRFHLLTDADRKEYEEALVEKAMEIVAGSNVKVVNLNGDDDDAQAIKRVMSERGMIPSDKMSERECECTDCGTIFKAVGDCVCPKCKSDAVITYVKG